MALSSAAQEAVWMRELISDLRNPPATSTEILEDNQSAISMAKNPQFHGRTKHINIKYHFIREQIANGTICLKYCPTEDMLADLLTKGIGPEKLERLRMSYGMCKQESVRRSVEEVRKPIGAVPTSKVTSSKLNHFQTASLPKCIFHHPKS